MLYTLDVYIASGPMTPKFIKRNPLVCRTIEIQGEHTLMHLHQAIFKALDREEEHMYEFQIGGKGPNDPGARRYGLSDNEGDTEGLTGNVRQTRMDALGLKSGDVFGYWFDFGDDWWHQINVVAVDEKTETGIYPRVTKKVGASPPQYEDETGRT